VLYTIASAFVSTGFVYRSRHLINLKLTLESALFLSLLINNLPNISSDVHERSNL